MFQSTHPHGVRPRTYLIGITYITVSIHAPTRGATYCKSLRVASIRVSIHAPTRGATQYVARMRERFRSFNPRTHTGCDVSGADCSLAKSLVSIHAPTRGATYCKSLRVASMRVSIHAPTRGATFCDIGRVLHLLLFQSTHPHGVRHRVASISSYFSIVSIHAPTRGATCLIIRTISHKSFQSTHPHGVRLGGSLLHLSTSGFNPRTHTGCDIMHLCPLTRLCMFQSTHPHGVRHLSPSRQSCIKQGFNPRTHTGCDCIFSKCLNINLIR